MAAIGDILTSLLPFVHLLLAKAKTNSVSVTFKITKIIVLHWILHGHCHYLVNTLPNQAMAEAKTELLWLGTTIKARKEQNTVEIDAYLKPSWVLVSTNI